MDDGNIAPANPSQQEPNQCNKRVETSKSNHKDVRRPTKMPETDNPTREKETSHRHIWRIVTQATQKSHHRRPRHISICPSEIRDSRKTPQRHVRDLNKKGKREMPLWMKIMIMRKRKSIPLCKGCHDDVHHNRPKSKRQGN